MKEQTPGVAPQVQPRSASLAEKYGSGVSSTTSLSQVNIEIGKMKEETEEVVSDSHDQQLQK